MNLPTKDAMNRAAGVLSKLGDDEADACAALFIAIADGRLRVFQLTEVPGPDGKPCPGYAPATSIPGEK